MLELLARARRARTARRTLAVVGLLALLLSGLGTSVALAGTDGWRIWRSLSPSQQAAICAQYCPPPVTTTVTLPGQTTTVTSPPVTVTSPPVTVTSSPVTVTSPPVTVTTPAPPPVTVTVTTTTPTTTTPSTWWTMQDPKAPITYVTNPSGLGLNVNNQAGGSYSDYAIDGGGDSSVLLQGTTNGLTLSRFHITRTKASPTVSWAAHGMYVKAVNNTFNDIYADNTGGNGVSGLSVRMHGNTFTRTVLKGYVHAVTYYEHDSAAGTVAFTNGTWSFTGDTAVWGDDSNEPATPYIKQAFVFENIDATGPAGAYFLKFGNSAYVSGALSYRGAGVTIRDCTINGKPVTSANVTGVPSGLLTIQ